MDLNVFNQILSDNKIVVADFYSTHCGPCMLMSKTVDALENEINDVKFVKVDVEEDEEVSQHFGITSIPTFFIFKDGEVADGFNGVMMKNDFKNIIDNIKKTE